MSDNGDGAISFFAGFLFGGIIGAGVALLLAPQTGDETREQIRTRGIELKDRAGEAALLAQERASEVEARGKVVLSERKSQVEAAIEEGKQVAAKTKKELQEKLAAARAGTETAA